MPRTQRQDHRLYPAKVLAGGMTAMWLGGLLYIAIDRDLNHAYIPFVAIALVGVITGMVVSVIRRLWKWLDDEGSASWTGLSLVIALSGLAALAVRRIFRANR